VLGGQGGDEIFGGYARYLIGYLDQSLRAAVAGETDDRRLSISATDLQASLSTLGSYLPLLRTFFAEGALGELDARYFRLVNRAPELTDEIDWSALGDYSPLDDYRSIFGAPNAATGSYFDAMTHFDFKTLLPALLHVEDRVSMAHGLESRVPLLDHPIVEFAATIPDAVKYRDGRLKRVLHDAARKLLPSAVLNRRDKMGFPVPLTEWVKGPARDFIVDALTCRAARERGYVNNRLVVERLDHESRYGRKLWGLLSLEIWQQELVDQGGAMRARLRDGAGTSSDAVSGNVAEAA
jgi:asparagine synthase (glutamine-hydrolysing)